MKKMILAVLFVAFAFSSAHASCRYDGGFTYNNCAARDNKCDKRPRVFNHAPAYVRVKTKTKVVNYYQTYVPTAFLWQQIIIL
ncbi:MAG: hypothetical protein LBK26_03320 [Rickettsiales bacterium]|jgi:hypothetical protein|nr:hypothetical protein [Rickettsiales bacterium]